MPPSPKQKNRRGSADNCLGGFANAEPQEQPWKNEQIAYELPSRARQLMTRVSRPPGPAAIAGAISPTTSCGTVAKVAAPLRPKGCNSISDARASQWKRKRWRKGGRNAS
eukprot:14106707-Alexandrium_andersonii.AAC.1